MATIRKRGEYSWEAQIRRKGHPTLTKTFLYKADAEAWARMTESEIERGTFISRTEAENTTLDKALERYEKEITALKGGSVKEGYVIKRFRADKLAQQSMATIRSADIAAWRDKRLKTVSPATVKRELVVLSHVFSIARREWHMESLLNPVEGITKPKHSRGRDRRVSEDEINAICAESNSLELPAIVRLGVETGMRRSELVNVCWKDIDLKARTIYLETTKNGEERFIPLSSIAVTTLTALQEAAKKETTAKQKEKGKTNVVTLDENQRVFACRPDTITQAFSRAIERARTKHLEELQKKRVHDLLIKNDKFLVDLTLHDLRHEATSRFFEKGLNVMEAASITGHKDLRMLKRYTHLKAEDLAKKLG